MARQANGVWRGTAGRGAERKGSARHGRQLGRGDRKCLWQWSWLMARVDVKVAGVEGEAHGVGKGGTGGGTSTNTQHRGSVHRMCSGDGRRPSLPVIGTTQHCSGADQTWPRGGGIACVIAMLCCGNRCHHRRACCRPGPRQGGTSGRPRWVRLQREAIARQGAICRAPTTWPE